MHASDLFVKASKAQSDTAALMEWHSRFKDWNEYHKLSKPLSRFENYESQRQARRKSLVVVTHNMKSRIYEMNVFLSKHAVLPDDCLVKEKVTSIMLHYRALLFRIFVNFMGDLRFKHVLLQDYIMRELNNLFLAVEVEWHVISEPNLKKDDLSSYDDFYKLYDKLLIAMVNMCLEICMTVTNDCEYNCYYDFDRSVLQIYGRSVFYPTQRVASDCRGSILIAICGGISINGIEQSEYYGAHIFYEILRDSFHELLRAKGSSDKEKQESQCFLRFMQVVDKDCQKAMEQVSPRRPYDYCRSFTGGNVHNGMPASHTFLNMPYTFFKAIEWQFFILLGFDRCNDNFAHNPTNFSTFMSLLERALQYFDDVMWLIRYFIFSFSSISSSMLSVYTHFPAKSDEYFRYILLQLKICLDRNIIFIVSFIGIINRLDFVQGIRFGYDDALRSVFILRLISFMQTLGHAYDLVSKTKDTSESLCHLSGLIKLCEERLGVAFDRYDLRSKGSATSTVFAKLSAIAELSIKDTFNVIKTQFSVIAPQPQPQPQQDVLLAENMKQALKKLSYSLWAMNNCLQYLLGHKSNVNYDLEWRMVHKDDIYIIAKNTQELMLNKYIEVNRFTQAMFSALSEGGVILTGNKVAEVLMMVKYFVGFAMNISFKPNIKSSHYNSLYQPVIVDGKLLAKDDQIKVGGPGCAKKAKRDAQQSVEASRLALAKDAHGMTGPRNSLHQATVGMPGPSNRLYHQATVGMPGPSNRLYHQATVGMPGPSNRLYHQATVGMPGPSDSLHQATVGMPGPSDNLYHQGNVGMPGPPNSLYHHGNVGMPGPSDNLYHQGNVGMPGPPNSLYHHGNVGMPGPSDNLYHQGNVGMPGPPNSLYHQGNVGMPGPSDNLYHQGNVGMPGPPNSLYHQGNVGMPGPSDNLYHQGNVGMPGPPNSLYHHGNVGMPGPSDNLYHQGNVGMPGPPNSLYHQGNVGMPGPSDNLYHQATVGMPGSSNSLYHQAKVDIHQPPPNMLHQPPPNMLHQATVGIPPNSLHDMAQAQYYVGMSHDVNY